MDDWIEIFLILLLWLLSSLGKLGEYFTGSTWESVASSVRFL